MSNWIPRSLFITCCCGRQSGGRHSQYSCLHISEVGESVLYCNLDCADKDHHWFWWVCMILPVCSCVCVPIESGGKVTWVSRNYVTHDNVHYIVVQLYLVSPPLFVLLNTYWKLHCSVTNTNCKPNKPPCKFFGYCSLQCCNYCHLLSEFLSKFQSFMTMFMYRNVRIHNI